MSATKDWTIWCDDPDCQQWTYGGGSNHTAKEARAGARKEGWYTGSAGDLCPEHSRKPPQ